MKLIGKYISFVPNNSGFVFVIGGFVMNSCLLYTSDAADD